MGTPDVQNAPEPAVPDKLSGYRFWDLCRSGDGRSHSLATNGVHNLLRLNELLGNTGIPIDSEHGA